MKDKTALWELRGECPLLKMLADEELLSIYASNFIQGDREIFVGEHVEFNKEECSYAVKAAKHWIKRCFWRPSP